MTALPVPRPDRGSGRGRREMFVNDRIAELSVSFFPENVAEGTDLMTPRSLPPGVS